MFFLRFCRRTRINRGTGYPIRSLYFDTPEDRDFHEKEDGIELRRKLRLRCYAPDAAFALLEMKQKQGDSPAQALAAAGPSGCTAADSGGLQRSAAL